ncbi:MAG: HEPN domain-containing protein [Chloroflexi bacterium]|nr:HEPN domain-containing protein [Chloroflexota bacterium]
MSADEAFRWLSTACGDLRGAEVILADQLAPCRHAALFAQQVAEKSLKAALAASAIEVPRSHDLRRLLRLVPDDRSVHRVAHELVDLTAYSVGARYPDAGSLVGRDEASEALDEAGAIYEAVHRDLGARGVAVDTMACE